MEAENDDRLIYCLEETKSCFASEENMSFITQFNFERTNGFLKKIGSTSKSCEGELNKTKQND